MKKEDIKKFATKIVEANPKTKELAKKITKRNAEYSKKDVNNIILSYLERNNYNNDVIETIMQYHPDKAFFDTLYEIKEKRKNVSRDNQGIPSSKENVQATREKEVVKDDKMDCAACATFSAEGDSQKDVTFINQKILMWSSAAVLVTVILLASTTK